MNSMLGDCDVMNRSFEHAHRKWCGDCIPKM